jgi:molecular chaperone GrpE
MLGSMSADTNENSSPEGGAIAAEPVNESAAEGSDIPVEVEAPDIAPANPEARIAELEAKLAAAEKDKKDNWDKYLRGAADLENLRKRQRRELDESKLEQRAKVLKEMLPVVDNLERAIEHAVSSAEGGSPGPIVEGVQLVLRQFATAFERLDVTGIEAMGQPFDPNLHEAISQLESDQPPGTIIQVLQRGYRSADRLLRPTLVVVAKAKAESA